MLIDDLFTLSNIEGEGQVVLTPLDFNGVVRQACDDHRTIAESKNLALTMDLTETSMRVVGISKQLFRLVGNLVGNAIHYTQQGTVTIRTSLQGNQAVLEVTDTGIGIPEERLGSIFERFFRTDEARDLRREGTGLGLAISKAIVEQHHGTIAVQSALGKGTTFRVVLPIDEGEPLSTDSE
jgi:signal transduction histidine kinase